MKEASWKDCLETNSARGTSVDRPKVQSLREMASSRIEYCEKLSVDEKSANFIFEDYYSALLELLHALLLLRGYKVNNHVCVGFFIRDILQRDDFYQVFDDCRFKRNSIAYYGRPMVFEVAKESIRKCISLIKEVEKIADMNLGKID